jgi:hypothetical protein
LDHPAVAVCTIFLQSHIYSNSLEVVVIKEAGTSSFVLRDVVVQPG